MLVYDKWNADCMLGRREDCPSKEGLREKLSIKTRHCETNEDEIITYNQWVQTDRSNIQCISAL